MKNLFISYKKLSYEQRVILITSLGLCFSTLLTCGKFIVGLFFNYNLCIIAIYTLALLLSKLECVKGAKSKTGTFSARNKLIAVFMFISSAIYIGFMGRGLFVSRSHASYQIYYVCFVALIAFLELGFSLVGIARTKNRGHYYRDIKVINFCIALIALLTTQITILDFTATTNVDKYNAWAGIIIGIVIAMCAVYILVAPKISIVDREHHAFILNQPDKNQLVDMSHTPSSLPLCKSAIYGTYSYNYIVEKDKVEGDIVLGKGFWHKINLPIKILCCLLAEILIFAWLIGKFIYFVRSANFPQKLENKFLDNGFEKFENKNA